MLSARGRLELYAEREKRGREKKVAKACKALSHPSIHIIYKMSQSRLQQALVLSGGINYLWLSK
jgi:hypothetical protein